VVYIDAKCDKCGNNGTVPRPTLLFSSSSSINTKASPILMCGPFGSGNASLSNLCGGILRCVLCNSKGTVPCAVKHDGLSAKIDRVDQCVEEISKAIENMRAAQ